MIPGIISRFIIFYYGLLKPGYLTYKALNGYIAEDSESWSKYWVIYSFLFGILAISNAWSWMLYYEETKLFFVGFLALTAPTTSVWIYDLLIEPIVSKYERQIDGFFKLRFGRIMYLVYLHTIQMTWLSTNMVQVIIQLGCKYVQPVGKQLWVVVANKLLHDPRTRAELNMDYIVNEVESADRTTDIQTTLLEQPPPDEAVVRHDNISEENPLLDCEVEVST